MKTLTGWFDHVVKKLDLPKYASYVSAQRRGHLVRRAWLGKIALAIARACYALRTGSQSQGTETDATKIATRIFELARATPLTHQIAHANMGFVRHAAIITLPESFLTTSQQLNK